jgi:hypothetical protein
LAKLKGNESKEEEIDIPLILVSFLKNAYVKHSEYMMDVPIQGLTVIGINTLEQDRKVKSYSEKRKVVEGEELLSQLTVHTMEGNVSKDLVQKLASGKMF